MGKKKNISSLTAKQEKKLLNLGVTTSAKDFKKLCKKTSNRIGIVTEGDSWFAYPRTNLIVGKRSNIIDWIVKKVKSTRKVNLLRLASNGDEASAMISGKQKHDLAEILKTNGSKVHFLLFSAGGNDVVGEWDMERLIQPYKEGYSAKDCIYQGRLKRKVQRIKLAYQELMELRDEYSPGTVIVTHTYDAVVPSKKGGKFLWGLVKTDPWIYPYLVAKGIPVKLHAKITDILLGAVGTELKALAAKSENKGRFVVVDTYGTLRPGHKKDWLNEIHPTPDGFKRITKKIYGEMRSIQTALPKWKK